MERWPCETNQGGAQTGAIDDGIEQYLAIVHFVGRSRQQPDTPVLVPGVLSFYGDSTLSLFMAVYRYGEEN